MGSSLLIITYHEYNPAAAVPEDMTANGIDWRAATWYDMAMGGAVANGTYLTDIGNVGSSLLSTNPTPDGADFAISWKVSATNPKSSDITVGITAKQAFPANGKLFIIVYQTKVHWNDDYGFTASNGQEYVYNAVRAIIGDTLGLAVPQLAVGGTHTVTHNYTAASTVIYPEKLRTAVMVQDMDTKEFVKVAYTGHSPLDTGTIPIIMDKYVHNKSALNIASFGARQIKMTLPFQNTTALLYNTAGRVLAKQSFSNVKGTRVTLNLPEARGVLFMKLLGENGKSVAVMVPFRE